MKKLLTLVMVLALSGFGLGAQENYEKAFRKIQKSSVMLSFKAVYQDVIVDPKTGKKTLKVHGHRYSGSGTIIGKRSMKNAPHIYYVLTSRHLMISHRDKLRNPIDDLKKAKSVSMAVGQFTHEGVEGLAISAVVDYWLVPVSDPKMDFAVVQFRSGQDLSVAKIHPNLPRNLFGKAGLTVASAGGLIPLPVVLRLGVNKPANAAKPYEFNFSGPTRAGMSGAAIFVLHEGEWKVAGIIEARYGGGGSFGFGIRADAIRSVLKLHKRSHWLEEK